MKKLILISVLVLIVLIAGCAETPQDPFQKTFGGVVLHFRANLNEAKNVPVYPNETVLKSVLLNKNVEGIGIAYVPNDTENSYYLAASYELAYKLTIINRYYFNETKAIDSVPVNSSLEAFSMASFQRPIIMLMGPPQTDQTAVNVAGYLITVQGSSFEESELNRTYNELDLATDKLLLVLIKELSI